MFRAATMRESSGKARVPGLHNRSTLKADENGLRPTDDHSGVCRYSEATRQTGVRPVPQRASGDDTTAPRTGKRHVEAKHSSNSEATRRVEGRIGVRKGWNTSTNVDSRRTWGADDDAVTPSAPADHTTMSSTKVRSADTAEQRAERNLTRAIVANPELKPQVERARADGTLIKLNDQVLRQQRVQTTHQHRDPMAMSPLRKSKDLGEETSTRPPFAVAKQDEAPANTHAKRTFDTAAMAEQRQQEADRKQRMRSGVYRHSEGDRPLPFDTNDGKAAYPEPPAVGKSVPFATRHMGKARADNARTDGTSADADTLSIQRAANRLQRSNVVAHANNPQDFIFGNIPPPTPNKNRSLTDAYEQRYATNNERPVSSGKAHTPRSYQKTALW